jgi:antitoxin CptB
MREIDLILGAFADARLAGLSREQLDRYAGLVENSDDDLYRWITGLASVPPAFDHDVMRLILAFVAHREERR